MAARIVTVEEGEEEDEDDDEGDDVDDEFNYVRMMTDLIPCCCM